MILQKVINFFLYGRKGKKNHDEKIKKAMQNIQNEITWRTGPGTGDEVQRVEAQGGKLVMDTCAYCGVQITKERMFEGCPKRSPQDLGHTIFKGLGEKADG